MHGIAPNSPQAKEIGFAELTEQPGYEVAGYELQADGRYKPIEDQQPEIRRLKKSWLRQS